VVSTLEELILIQRGERNPPDPDPVVQPFEAMRVATGHEEHAADGAFQGGIPATEHAITRR
jgi:hypothetical protein